MVDELVKKIEKMNNPTVVGLDPTLEYIPEFIQKKMFKSFSETPLAVSKMFLEFNKKIIDAISDIVPAVKPQIAMYERYGADGIEAYIKTIEYAKSKDLIVIGDVKRGDIASTATAYASHLGGSLIGSKIYNIWKEDFITVNPYLGTDGIKPFVDVCKKKGIFVLVKTSNPSSAEIQNLFTENGKRIYEKVADLVCEWGKPVVGSSGFSNVGAVVGATHKEEGAFLRKCMPNTFFLVPGYGAQGGTGKDLKGFFCKDGRGCIVNSSRGIFGAYKKNTKNPLDEGRSFAQDARNAALLMKEDIRF